MSWDSEFDAKKGQGERPGHPVCICAVEIDSSGRVTEHRLKAPYPATPPWDHGPDDPYAAIVYAGSAEAGSCMNIGWAFPPLIIDLYAEYMVIHNTEMVRKAGRDGESKPPGPGLIKACQRYRVKVMDQDHKDEMRRRIYEKTVHTEKDIEEYQDYCLNDDCWAGIRLFKAMRPYIDFLRAPIRGAFMMEIERMRWHGIPIDTPTYYRAEQCAGTIASAMREDLNRKLRAEAWKIYKRMAKGKARNTLKRALLRMRKDKTGVYYQDVFKSRTMLALMRACGIPLPVDPKTGKYSCATKLLKSMIGTYPLLKLFYEDKRMIDAVKNLKLEIGSDGRNRCWLNPFGTKTGRNNPSTNRYIFGLPHTMRSYAKPPLGWAFASVDVGAEEVGIAAALSKDPVLMADYLSGDPYRQFAAAALGVLNPTEQQRQAYKAVVLGRIYGKGVVSLARDLGISRQRAQEILDQMKARYSVLDLWLKRVLNKVAHAAPIVCTLGWSLASSGRPGEERTFLNYPMQGNGSELMRLIIVRAGAAGLRLIGCAHDSFMIEAPIDQIEADVVELQEVMRQASRDLFDGFELRADCKPERDIVKYPARFIDKREMEDDMVHWNRLMDLIGVAPREAVA